MTKKNRRNFTAEQKLAIVKQHLVDKTPVSEVCEQNQIQPTQFYQWQKQLFENGAAAFEKNAKSSAKPSGERRKIDQLQAKLAVKNEVIAELMEENVKAKKELGEL